MNYSEQINRENVPQHIAIIMDGNGRWAQMRGMERSQGHQAGAATVHQLVENALRLGVKYLTLYTFSTLLPCRRMCASASRLVCSTPPATTA